MVKLLKKLHQLGLLLQKALNEHLKEWVKFWHKCYYNNPFLQQLRKLMIKPNVEFKKCSTVNTSSRSILDSKQN